MPHSNPTDLPPTPTSVPEIPLGTPCPSCGYDLAGLSPDGRCPECGAANRNALVPYRLANASPAFVRRLHIGATLTQIWAAIEMAWILVWEFLSPLVGGITSLTVWRYMSLFYLCTMLFGYLAWWLVSSPDPSKPSLAKQDKARRVFRILLIVSLSLFVGARALGFARVIWVNVPYVADVMAWLVFAAAFIASIVYLRSLARRIPSDKFHRSATIILRVCVAATLLNTCLNLFWFVGVAEIISGIAMYLPYFFLLHLTRRELKNIRSRM